MEQTNRPDLARIYREIGASAKDLYRFLHWYVGVASGEHSGDEQCVMRYFFAHVYPAAGQDKTYYIGFNEPTGVQICADRKGTGVNAPDRKPQPRYFDAAPRRGECRKWICVNNAIPPDHN
jgi:hypothetical protein